MGKCGNDVCLVEFDSNFLAYSLPIARLASSYIAGNYSRSLQGFLQHIFVEAM
jgi:hypothetical protein